MIPPVNDLLRLDGRVAVVTGAASGIGTTIARRLSEAGARVCIHYRTSETTAQAVAEDIRADGGDAMTMQADVTKAEDVTALFDAVAERFESVDLLVNNAGNYPVTGLMEMTPADWDGVIETNLRSVFLCTQAAARHMTGNGGGSIVNTSSNSGVFLDKGMLAYITTKAAVIMMTKQIALDYAKYNIRCNALCPGWVDTPFNEPYIRQMGGRQAIEKYVSETIPMGRWASVEEIAESILFLASDRSSFMTGHALVVDGGECIA